MDLTISATAPAKGRYAGIARLVKRNSSEHAGMGIVVGASQVLTCAHVANIALRRSPGAVEKPESTEAISVLFPYLDRSHPIQGSVDHWRPMGDAPGSDIATLRLSKEVPRKVGVASLASVDSLDEHAFRVIGFRPDLPDGSRDKKGQHVKGRIVGLAADGTAEMHGEGFEGPFIVPGFSGAAVWDTDLGAFVGMISQRDREGALRVAYLIPAQQIKANCPDLPIHSWSESQSQSMHAGRKRRFRPPKVRNFPPVQLPSPFFNRDQELEEVQRFLTGNKRLMVVEGRPGQGKTSLLCYAVNALCSVTLRGSGQPCPTAGIVYLSATGAAENAATAQNLFEGICDCLPSDVGPSVKSLLAEAATEPARQILGLLRVSDRTRIVILLDNLEAILDANFCMLSSHVDLEQALHALLCYQAPHSMKIIIATQTTPSQLVSVEPGLQAQLSRPLQGLSAEFTRELLTDLHARIAEEDELIISEAHRRTYGNPRALQALIGELRAAPDRTLRDVLQNTTETLPEKVVWELVGKLFESLSPEAQQAMQVLAVFGQPIGQRGVEFVLTRFFIPPGRIKPLLDELSRRYIVGRMRRTRQTKSGLYYLHSTDQAYALAQLSKTEMMPGANSEFSLRNLKHLAANFFRSRRKGPSKWKTVRSVAPQLQEFNLRLEADEGASAAEIALEIHEFLRRIGRLPDLARMYRRVLRIGKVDAQLTRRCRLKLAQISSEMGDYEAAADEFTRVLDEAQVGADTLTRAVCLSEISVCSFFLGHLTEAVAKAQEARSEAQQLTESRAAERHRIELRAGHALGLSFYLLGEFADSLRWLKRAWKTAEMIGDVEAQAEELTYLAQFRSYFRQDYGAAKGEAERAIDLADQNGLIVAAAHARTVLAFITIQKEDYCQAITLLETARVVLEPTLHRTKLTMLNWCLSYAQLWAGYTEQAYASAVKGCAYNDFTNNSSQYAQLGTVCLHLGEPKQAEKAFQESLGHARKLLGKYQSNCEGVIFKVVAHGGIAMINQSSHQVEQASETFQHLSDNAQNASGPFLGRVLATVAASGLAVEILTPLLSLSSPMAESFNKYLEAFPKSSARMS